MARVRSGALGVASDSEAEVGPGGRQSRWEIPPPSYDFPKAVKLENRPQQFVDKCAAECSVRWVRAFQPKEGLNCILAAFTVGPDLFSLSSVFGYGGAFGSAPTRALRILPECDGVPLPLDFILHRALCRVHFWPPAIPRGAHVSGSHSAEALRASHLQSTYSKNGAWKTWAKHMVCAAVSHRGGCASHAGGLMLLSRTWRDTLSMWMNPKCSCTSMM